MHDGVGRPHLLQGQHVDVPAGGEQVRRRVLPVRAELAHGDSGSALVLADGTVAGVAFAVSAAVAPATRWVHSVAPLSAFTASIWLLSSVPTKRRLSRSAGEPQTRPCSTDRLSSTSPVWAS